MKIKIPYEVTCNEAALYEVLKSIKDELELLDNKIVRITEHLVNLENEVNKYETNGHNH